MLTPPIVTGSPSQPSILSFFSGGGTGGREHSTSSRGKNVIYGQISSQKVLLCQFSKSQFSLLCCSTSLLVFVQRKHAQCGAFTQPRHDIIPFLTLARSQCRDVLVPSLVPEALEGDLGDGVGAGAQAHLHALLATKTERGFFFVKYVTL